MAMSDLTRESYAKLRQLHNDRERVLGLGFLHTGTPVSADHEEYEDFLEYRKKKAQPISQPPSPVPVVNLYMLPPSTIPIGPPDISGFLYQTLSNLQLNTWPANHHPPHFQGHCSLPASLEHAPRQAGPSEEVQRATEPTVISTVKAPPRIIEELHEPEPSEPEEKVEMKEEQKKSPDPKSIQIFHPFGGFYCDVAAELDHSSPLNWISRALLEKSGISIRPTKYVSHDTPSRSRLESSHRAKLDWKVSSSPDTMQHDFWVHDGDSTAPAIIIGKPILEVHSEDYFPSHKYCSFEEVRLLSKVEQKQSRHEKDRLSIGNSLRRPRGVKGVR